YTLNVKDLAANIGTAFDALSGNTHVTKIVVTDSQTNEVAITVSQFATDGDALSELVKADGSTQATVKIVDTAADISAAVDNLNGSTQVDKIVVSDSGTGG